MKIPKLWRREKGGKYIGAWHVTIRGERINLRSKDATEARKRAAAAVRGRRDFQDGDQAPDVEQLVTALDSVPQDSSGGGGGGDHAPTPSPQEGEPADPPPEVIPPGPADAGDVAGDVNAAAGASAAAAAPPTMPVDPEFLTGIIHDAAGVLVEVQIRAQEWAWRRYRKVEVARIPPDHPCRDTGVKLWEGQLRKWLPTEIPIPDWAAAIVMVGLNTMPVQLAEVRPAGQEPATATTGDQPVAEAA